MGKVTVELRKLCIGYTVKRGVKQVAGPLDGCISSGELTCLIGENGVGKSTLLRTLSGFQSPLSGSIMVDGRELSAIGERELARTIGVVLTERPDVQQMTVEELVAMGRSPYTDFWGRLQADDRKAISEAISLVGIEALRSRQVTTLSDGERQKVMIAKALAQQTPVVYLDEPTAFLDYPSKVDMLLLLRRISREADKTIFLSTHDLELALQAADTVWLMTRHEGMHTGTPRQLADDGSLSSFIERGGIRFDAATLSVRICP